MRFYYVAQNKYRALSKGDIEASSKEAAIKSLMNQGLEVIKLDLIGSDASRGSRIIKRIMSLNVGGENLNTFDQISIARNLGTILNTGTDLTSALDIIARDAVKPAVKKIIYDLHDKVLHGERLSDAMFHWKEQFNPIFISLVKAGEASGSLPHIFITYSQELRKDYNFMRKLKGAMVYPAILVTSLVGMMVIILTVVAPRLKEVFASTKATPPIYSRMFFALSDFWLAHIIGTSIAFGIIVLAMIVLIRNKRTRRRLVLILNYLPVLNKIQKNLVLMRFLKTVASLLNAGFTLKSALMTASDVVSLKYSDVLTEIAKEKLERGLSFSQALKEYPAYFPGILVSVIATGEKSAQLSEVMTQMGEFYEEEVFYGLEFFLTLIEPILLLVVGLVVGLMAASLIAPIYRLIGGLR